MQKKSIANAATLMAEVAVHGIQEKKGKDIACLDLRLVKGTVSDYFVICNADSTTQVRAIADSVEDEIFKATGENPWKKEGHQNCEWICLDYINVVVHVFRTDMRDHYNLEELWGDAQVIHYKTA